MTVRTTAQADLDIIGIYVEGAAQFGVEQAERYHAGMMATFELLAEHPQIARERPELHAGVRLHPYQSHLIVYAVRDFGILIVRVLHGRQDWERHLGADG